MLASAEDILAAVSAMASRYRPQSVVLFGSYAYGRPTPDSDVDLLVLKDFSGSPHHQFVEVRRLLDVRFPIDLLVRCQDDVADRIEAGIASSRKSDPGESCSMTKLTLEWVEKAESDYDVISLLIRSRKKSRFDPICFHVQ